MLQVNIQETMKIYLVFYVDTELPQDVQELTNFFEKRVSAYQVGVTGDVAFNESV